MSTPRARQSRASPAQGRLPVLAVRPVLGVRRDLVVVRLVLGVRRVHPVLLVRLGVRRVHPVLLVRLGVRRVHPVLLVRLGVRRVHPVLLVRLGVHRVHPVLLVRLPDPRRRHLRRSNQPLTMRRWPLRWLPVTPPHRQRSRQRRLARLLGRPCRAAKPRSV
jgi:hypothetical protein